VKIGIISEYYYPYVGGIAEHVHNTYLYLKQNKIEAKIITPHINKFKFKGQLLLDSWTPHKDVIHIGESYPFYNNGGFVRITSPIGLRKKLKNILNKEKFDLVHIHSPLVPFLPIIAVQIAECPVVGTFHTIFNGSLFYKTFRRYFEKLITKINTKICVSPPCANIMQKYFDCEYSIVPNGVDTKLFNPNGPTIKEFKEDNIKNIMFLGRFDPHNGLEILLKAFIKVKHTFNNCRLIVVGDGPLYYKYKKIAQDYLDSIYFVGTQHLKRPDFYRTADIFCQPATLHSLSIVNLEAMATGLPIVASDLVAFKWLMQDCAVYFQNGNIDALAKTLLILLDSQQQQKVLSEKALQRVKQFSWDVIGSCLVNHFNMILNNKQEPALQINEEIKLFESIKYTEQSYKEDIVC
jgi:phosphatidylinositol alpha-mannosyltransferase